MQLHCLGTAGYHPNRDRHTSCYFLPESGICLDGGTGMFRLADLIETETLDVLLTHAHLDHIAGLTFLLDILHKRPVKQLNIWGEAAKLDAIRTHLFSDLIFPVQLDADWKPIDDLESFSIGDAEITWRAQDHPGGSVAYRIDWNERSNGGAAKAAEGSSKRLVYCTDTTGDVSEEHARWSSDADLMLHECYFRDVMQSWAEKTGHSWTRRVIEVAMKSMPAKLLVTHINPIDDGENPVDLDIMNEALPMNVSIAVDGGVVEF